jgi:hypothetical protein
MNGGRYASKLFSSKGFAFRRSYYEILLSGLSRVETRDHDPTRSLCRSDFHKL